LVMVDEIPVQVDVLFRDASYPGKAVAVQRVDKDQANIFRQRVCFTTFEEAGENPGAAKAFDAVGRGVAQKDMWRVFAAEQGDICEHGIAVRAGRACVICGDLRTGFVCGGEKPGPTGPVIMRKIFNMRHGLRMKKGLFCVQTRMTDSATLET